MFRASLPALAALAAACFAAPPVPAETLGAVRLPAQPIARFVPPPSLEERVFDPAPLHVPLARYDFDVIAAQGMVTIVVRVEARPAEAPLSAFLLVDHVRVDAIRLDAQGRGHLQAVVPEGARVACAGIYSVATLPRDQYCEELPAEAPELHRFHEAFGVRR